MVRERSDLRKGEPVVVLFRPEAGHQLAVVTSPDTDDAFVTGGNDQLPVGADAPAVDIIPGTAKRAKVSAVVGPFEGHGLVTTNGQDIQTVADKADRRDLLAEALNRAPLVAGWRSEYVMCVTRISTSNLKS